MLASDTIQSSRVMLQYIALSSHQMHELNVQANCRTGEISNLVFGDLSNTN
jgi:hypothetical protein